MRTYLLCAMLFVLNSKFNFMSPFPLKFNDTFCMHVCTCRCSMFMYTSYTTLIILDLFLYNLYDEYMLNYPMLWKIHTCVSACVSIHTNRNQMLVLLQKKNIYGTILLRTINDVKFHSPSTQKRA